MPEAKEEKSKPGPKPKAKPSLPVKVMKAEKEIVLVEYVADDVYRRVYIPPESLEDGRAGKKVAVDVLESGMPFGVMWEDCEIPQLSEPAQKDLVNELRRNGIYDYADLLDKSLVARAAISRVLVPVMASLIKFSKLIEEGGK